MRVVLAPDKFSGSLTSAEVAAALASGLRSVDPDLDIVLVPVADGGDGTIAAVVAAGFDRVEVLASGPTGEVVAADYARRGEVAVVELAEVCGFARLPGGRPEPMTASSFGVGEVLAAALDAGAAEIVLGLGGSASTDGGLGMLQALGARALDARGEPVRRGGVGLLEVATLDLAALHPRLAGVRLTVASDVDNPLCGPNGAAAVYAPQKGATAEQVRVLDRGLSDLARLVARVSGTDHSATPGAGAAGGVGFGALVLGARLRAGSDLLLDLIGFGGALAGADLVITGEGSMDEQTLAGKAPMGVAAAARRLGVPVLAVVGRSTLSDEQVAGTGIGRLYRLSDLEPDLRVSMARAADLVRRIGERIGTERADL